MKVTFFFVSVTLKYKWVLKAEIVAIYFVFLAYVK